MYPRLNINLEKIKHNAQTILNLCKKNNIEMFAVTKVTSADINISNVLMESGINKLADSRIKNLIRLRKNFPTAKLMLLRIPMLSELEDVVDFCDYSLISELETIFAIDRICVEKNKDINLIIMFDLGDLREGIRPEKLNEYISKLKQLKRANIDGIGVNLACYGGVIPTFDKLKELTDIYKVFSENNYNITTISGGNSSSLPLLLTKDIPENINNLRIGEAIMLGRNVINRDPWPETYQDTFTFEAEIIELQEKPSVPIGETGQDAFGNTPVFEDKGNIYRAILAAGRQDVDIDGLIPLGNFEVLGASSDHIIIDVTAIHNNLKVGDKLEFMLSYGALLAASTSEYVSKNYIN